MSKPKTTGLSGSLLAWAAAILLVLLVAVTYQATWRAGFIWDDDAHLTANPCIVGPLGLKEIWTTAAARICPLTLTVFWAEHALWGLNPLPYHVFNVLVHGACAVLLWWVLDRLRVRGAWLGAALWALHPAQVETAAWITELKNILSCLFFLAAVLFFAKWRQDERRLDYGCALGFAALAMASKSSTVVLPAVLILCAWWMDGRWPLRWRAAVYYAPFFALSALTSALSIYTQKLEGGMEMQAERHLPERLVVCGKVIWFYLGKLVWPKPLVFIYPRWEIDASHAAACLPTAAAAAAWFVLWRYRAAWARPVFFSFSYFLVALFPVLGLVDHYFLRYSFVGDHFQYLASIGPLALAAAGVLRASDACRKIAFILTPALSAALLLALGTASWGRAPVYYSEETLWNDTLAKNPRCWMAYNNLGVVRKRQGRLEEAIWHFNEALRFKPDYVMAQNNLGTALAMEGKVEEAVPHYLEVLRLKPDHANAHNNLGSALRLQGRTSEAITHYREALRLEPDMVDALKNLAWIRAAYDRPDLRNGTEALALASHSVELTAGKDPWTLDALAAALAETRRFQEAAETCRKARELALASGQAEFARQLDEHRDLYELGLPCRISQ